VDRSGRTVSGRKGRTTWSRGPERADDADAWSRRLDDTVQQDSLGPENDGRLGGSPRSGDALELADGATGIGLDPFLLMEEIGRGPESDAEEAHSDDHRP